MVYCIVDGVSNAQKSASCHSLWEILPKLYTVNLIIEIAAENINVIRMIFCEVLHGWEINPNIT
jgi:hypothetical protein